MNIKEFKVKYISIQWNGEDAKSVENALYLAEKRFHRDLKRKVTYEPESETRVASLVVEGVEIMVAGDFLVVSDACEIEILSHEEMVKRFDTTKSEEEK